MAAKCDFELLIFGTGPYNILLFLEGDFHSISISSEWQNHDVKLKKKNQKNQKTLHLPVKIKSDGRNNRYKYLIFLFSNYI